MEDLESIVGILTFFKLVQGLVFESWKSGLPSVKEKTLFMKFALKALHSEHFSEDEGRNDDGLEADGSTSAVFFFLSCFSLFLH